MTITDAIAACGTEHVPYSIKFYAPRCVVCKEFSPCTEALRAALEYALRDAEAWRRIAVTATDAWQYLIGGKVDLEPGDLADDHERENRERAERIATEAHRLVLAQMEEERKHG